MVAAPGLEKEAPKTSFLQFFGSYCNLEINQDHYESAHRHRARYTCALELKIVAQKDWLKTVVVHLNNIKQTWRNPEMWRNWWIPLHDIICL